MSEATKERPEPVTVSIPAAAKIIGIGESLAYEAAARGEIPTVQIGKRKLVPVAWINRTFRGV